MALEDVSRVAAGAWGRLADGLGGRLQRHLWQRRVRQSLVMFPHEGFRQAFRVRIPAGEEPEWIPAVLVVTTFRLLVLSEGHLYVEYDIGSVAQAFAQEGDVSFTLRGDQRDSRITVQTEDAVELQSELVEAAQRRLAGKDKKPSVDIPHVIAAAVHVAAEMNASERDRSQ